MNEYWGMSHVNNQACPVWINPTSGIHRCDVCACSTNSLPFAGSSVTWIHIYTRGHLLLLCVCVCVCVCGCVCSTNLLSIVSPWVNWIRIYEYTCTNVLPFVSPSVTWIRIYEYTSMNTYLCIHMYERAARQLVGNLNTHLYIHIFEYSSMNTHLRTCYSSSARR